MSPNKPAAWYYLYLRPNRRHTLLSEHRRYQWSPVTPATKNTHGIHFDVTISRRGRPTFTPFPRMSWHFLAAYDYGLLRFCARFIVIGIIFAAVHAPDCPVARRSNKYITRANIMAKNKLAQWHDAARRHWHFAWRI